MPIPKSILERVTNLDASLEILHLSSQYPPLDDEDMSALVAAVNKNNNAVLKTLVLNDNTLGDEGVKVLTELKNITSLSVAANGLTDASADLLGSMHSLTDLDISGNQITDNGLQRIIKNLPQLARLTVSGDEIGEGSKQTLLANQTLIQLIVTDPSQMQPDVLDQLEKHVMANRMLEATKTSAGLTFFEPTISTAPASIKTVNEDKVRRKTQLIMASISLAAEELSPPERELLKQYLKDSIEAIPTVSIDPKAWIRLSFSSILQDHLAAVKALVKAGASLVACDQQGRRPVDIAGQWQQDAIQHCLVTQAASNRASEAEVGIELDAVAASAGVEADEPTPAPTLILYQTS